MNNYEWLSQLRPNSWSIEMNEHACNYVDAKKWIEQYNLHDQFNDTPPELIEQMKNTNTIYRLQIYPNTPNGFNFWYGPTLDSVIEQARADG